MKKLISLFCLMLGLSSAQALAADTPVDIIKDGSRQVLDVLKQDNGKNTKQVRQQAETIAVPLFDFPRMTALAVGIGWRQATPEQRTQLTQQFQTLLVRTYSTTMTRFKTAQVNVQANPVISANGRDATVKSSVTLPGNANPVAVDYVLNKGDKGWKIYNVSVEGASLVTVYRNSFNEEIQKSGVDGLIKLLQDKNAAPGAAAPAAKGKG
ncbi:phospholipid-binding protein MlaC [Chromobacterium sp. IIBBL 290-4]|uniref:MlaC/ttg2D family ABC transporter substrate-binding protein n=1 Tax=Chromobacterium sp. IIBBL 290-4 TaxID=2953890 RepID=UPI0020B6BA39|nr:ABC transporter substrate-binding protein [Chromobacterium sp. IIBBL 290-4]UTH76129.1 ABC transporter substrate-binding protein [Chromobacterium sp. IIBBL 290-4]